MKKTANVSYGVLLRMLLFSFMNLPTLLHEKLLLDAVVVVLCCCFNHQGTSKIYHYSRREIYLVHFVIHVKGAKLQDSINNLVNDTVMTNISIH